MGSGFCPARYHGIKGVLVRWTLTDGYGGRGLQSVGVLRPNASCLVRVRESKRHRHEDDVLSTASLANTAL